MINDPNNLKFKDYAIIGVLVILSISTIYFFRMEGPTGYVTLEPGIAESTTFYNKDISLSCSALGEGEEQLVNATAIITNQYGESWTNTKPANGTSFSDNFEFNDVHVGQFGLICKACTDSFCNQSSSISFNVLYNVTTQSAPVVNLTFDDSNYPWRDYSNLNHQFTKSGATNWADSASCKWYGCADFTTAGGDYIGSNTRFSLDNGMAVSFWLKPTSQVGQGFSQAYYELGTGNNYKYSEEAQYGINTKWNSQSGQVGGTTGSSFTTTANQWTHYFIEYDESRFIVWKNGEVIRNVSQSYGNLNFTVGEAINVGKGIYGIDLIGYLDEFVLWNRGDFSHSDVNQIYDSRKLGTPPELDIYVKNVNYTLPYNWASSRNELDLTGTMDIHITIANAGMTESTGSFDTKFELNGNTICTHTTSLDAGEEETFTCAWPKSAGWHSGKVIADYNNNVNENSYEGGDKTNNEFFVYIPMESHPRFRFNQDDWDNTLKPFFTNSNNEISYNAYNTHKSFVSEDFNPSWGSDNVDPRGKKGFENALNCYINNYAPSEACTRAKNHLQGWLVTVDDWEDGSVQALHEVIHVAATYDLMFPSLSQEEAELYGKKLKDICLDIYGKPNVQPHTDSGLPSPGNGQGFGTGMAAACYVAIGDNPENPNIYWDDPQSYNDKSTIYYWTNRIENHLKGFKDDQEGIYPEGMLYHWYSKYHLVNVLWFLKRTGISDVTDEHQNAICSFAKEASRNILDHTYNGNTLRGDVNQAWRQVSFGDTYSYQPIGDYGVDGWDTITIYGLLCDDVEVKQAARKLRYLGYETGAQTRGVGGLYYYPLLARQVDLIDDIGEVIPAFSFAKSFDRLTLRRGFTYINDTVIIFDGGDEAQGGHPNAEFQFFVYAMGEPFIDFTQVPYEDDVRTEVWQNTISFSQSTVTGYNTNPGTAILHQYYGGKDIEGTYPDFFYMPEAYRGDVINTIGTKDGSFAGAHAYKPYKTAITPVVRDFVVFDNVLVHTDYVKRNTAGTIYANWLNIYDEFTPSIQGDKLTLTRAGTNKHYVIDGVWSSAGTISLAGGDSGKAYCFQKTSCNGGKGNYGKYYHSVEGPNATTILAHHWYQGDDPITITEYVGTDRGITANYNGADTIIVFDTNEDGIIDEEDYLSDARIFALRQNIIAGISVSGINHEGNTIYESSEKTSVYLDYSEPGMINATVGLDSSATIRIYLQSMSSASLKLNGETSLSYTISEGDLVLNLDEGNHFLEIELGGDSIPVVTQNQPGPFFLSGNSSEIYFNCSAIDDNQINLIEILTNSSGSMSVELSEVFSSTSASLYGALNFSNGTFQWSCRATDDSEQSTTSQTRTFTVGGSENTAPTVNMLSPADYFSTMSTLVQFSCEGEDEDNNLESVSLLSDRTGNFTTELTVAASGSYRLLSATLSFSPGNYSWACKATDSNGAITFSENRTVEFLENNTPPIYTTFNGDTTNFNELQSLRNVSNVTLENTNYGKVAFINDISNIAGLNFDEAVLIQNHTITVNASLYSQLNVPARLSFYNIYLNNPVIKKDGTSCSGCFNTTYVNSTYSFTVLGFSTFTIEEAPSNISNTTTLISSSGGGRSSGGSGAPPSISGVVEEVVVKKENDKSVDIQKEVDSVNEEASQESPSLESPEQIEAKKKIFVITRGLYLIMVGFVFASFVLFLIKADKDLVRKEIYHKTLRQQIYMTKKKKNLGKMIHKYKLILEEYNSLSEEEKAKHYQNILELYNLIQEKKREKLEI